MKNRKIKQILSSGLAAVLACGMISGCTQGEKEPVIEPMEKVESDAVSFDYIGGKDVMPIGGFYGPHYPRYSYDGESQPNLVSDEIYQALADAGINLIFSTNEDYAALPEVYENILQLGEKYGIGIFVKDSRILNSKGEDTISAAQMGQYMSDYTRYQSFCGVYVADEPNHEEYLSSGDSSHNVDQYGNIVKNLNKLDINYYLNLLPLYDATKKAGYDKYIQSVLTECEPKYLLYDFYVWDEGHTKADYFYNMSVIRKNARSVGIPFWTFIQAGSYWNDSAAFFDTEPPYTPNEKQFDWNVNTCLAYGSQGISYFPLVQPPWYPSSETERFNFERNCFFGAWGNKNQWYYYAQTINKHIAAIDEVLMNAVHQGVMATCDEAVKDTATSDCILKGKSWRELSNVTGDALIGCFNYQGKTALYVVNYDTEYAQDIQLELSKNCKLQVIQNSETTKTATDTLTLSMQAGEGVLVVFES